ncbi:MAG: hypothetical protein ACE5JI_18750, partial [Acidobacteriota bacterium]
MMWPKKNTAFVVIHGAGPRRPFQTLDSFVRGFWEVLKEQNQASKVRWQHKLQRHKDWIENYISLAPEGKPTLDFYEYYWDCYMVHEITIEDVIDWLNKASAGARRFYAKMPELAKEYEELGVDLFKDGEFRSGGYLTLLGWVGRVLRVLPLVRIPIVGSLIKPLLKWVSKFIVNLLGDVVIYTTADVRSRNYEIRQKVLRGAVEELRLLLENDYYEQIIVVGHSLGSVIAYDALNRITHDMSAEGGISPELAPKIAGLVTFGSPLDKIAFFFREHTADEEYVRRQILAHFHGFKSLPLPGDDEPSPYNRRAKPYRQRGEGPSQEPRPIENPIEPYLDKARWLNFYHLQDPISGALDAYKVDRYIRCEK